MNLYWGKYGNMLRYISVGAWCLKFQRWGFSDKVCEVQVLILVLIQYMVKVLYDPLGPLPFMDLFSQIFWDSWLAEINAMIMCLGYKDVIKDNYLGSKFTIIKL